MKHRSIIKDTIKLTAVQFFLECISLLLNVWMTKKIGSSTVGVVALTSSFFQLAATAANGNGFLCTSRFVSEELGKPNGNPNKILCYALCFCLALGIPIASTIFFYAEPLSLRFLKSTELAAPVRLLALILPIGGICACLKGYLNAACQVTYAAICDILECLTRCGILIYILQVQSTFTNQTVCTAMAVSTGISTIICFLLLVAFCQKSKIQKTGTATLSMKKYIKLAIPVLFGGCLTATLSSANDALIPITLKQAGNSTAEAFSQFGIFEAIVIPVLFFPSTILCALSGILITEAARATSSGNHIRMRHLTESAIQRTLQLSIFIAGGLLVYAHCIGQLLDGGDFAGHLIRLLAPVVPFIYLEIILEALMKGMGKQSFSSINYLAEYTIRIAIVLICIPLFGFYGIVLSYYTSNICGNCSRLIQTCRTARATFSFWQMIGLPLFCTVFAFQIPKSICYFLSFPNETIWLQLCCLLLSIGIYFGLLHLLSKRTAFSFRHATCAR